MEVDALSENKRNLDILMKSFRLKTFNVLVLKYKIQRIPQLNKYIVRFISSFEFH